MERMTVDDLKRVVDALVERGRGRAEVQLVENAGGFSEPQKWELAGVMVFEHPEVAAYDTVLLMAGAKCGWWNLAAQKFSSRVE